MPPKKTAKAKIDFENEEEDETLIGFMSRKLDAAFVNNIPLQSIRDLPDRYMYLFGALAHIFSISCFLYFTYIGYTALRTQKTLSLDDNSGICRLVGKEVSGVYVGDEFGHWAGVSSFKDEYGLYRLELNNFKDGKEEYQKIMRYFKQLLREVGRGARNRSLASNLVYWMTWQPWYVDGENVQKFGMNSDPIYVFDRSYIAGGLGNWEGNCPLHTVNAYDRANGIVSISFHYPDFINEPLCTSQMDPLKFGYIPEYDGDTFTIKLDVTAFATAVAVNLMVLQFQSLIVIPGLPQSVIPLPDGSTLSTSFRYLSRCGRLLCASWYLIYLHFHRYHPQYPGMIPLVCMQFNPVTGECCFLHYNV